MSQYQQLTQEKRYAIYVLLQEEKSHRHIARQIGVHHSTVSREIKRNTRIRAYRHGVAQELASERRAKVRCPSKLTAENKLLLGAYLRKHWSPEQVAGRLKLEGILNISYETIYKYIRQNIAEGGKLYKSIRRSKKYRKKRISVTEAAIANRVSIEQRPDIVAEKSRLGDWELDTMISRQHPSVLVTMVERKSKYTFIGWSESKHAPHVARSIRFMFKHNKDKVLTITSDNGLEFAHHRQICSWLNARYYFCHPYSSWERGLNENTNGLIRFYAPKGESFEHLGPVRLRQIMENLNTRPRKSLGYLTPKEVYRGIAPTTACG